MWINFIERKMDLIYEFDMFDRYIHNLNAEFSAKVVAFDAQQFNYELCEEEKMLISQLEELKLEGQLLDHTFIDVVPVEMSTLELCKEVDNIIFKNSSVYKYEDVNKNMIHELGRIGPHSNHFSPLCLDDEILIESSEPIEEFMDEE